MWPEGALLAFLLLLLIIEFFLPLLFALDIAEQSIDDVLFELFPSLGELLAVVVDSWLVLELCLLLLLLSLPSGLPLLLHDLFERLVDGRAVGVEVAMFVVNIRAEGAVLLLLLEGSAGALSHLVL